MPFLAAAIWGALANVLASLIGRAIVALGISAVAYVGIDALVTKVSSYVAAQIGGVAPDVLSAAQYFGIIAAINMHLAAFTAWAAIVAGKTAIGVTKK